jgi:hypothetical protein
MALRRRQSVDLPPQPSSCWGDGTVVQCTRVPCLGITCTSEPEAPSRLRAVHSPARSPMGPQGGGWGSPKEGPMRVCVHNLRDLSRHALDYHAPSRHHLEGNGIVCRLEGHYPFFFAHTGSCARPKPSHRLQFPSPMGLCRLLPVPAGRWPFPTLSLNSLCRCLDPYPAMFSWCTRPFLPRRRRLHIWWSVSRTSHAPGNAASAGEPFSRLQSFAHVQAPALAQPPGCTHREMKHRSRAARPYTPRRTRLVNLAEQRYRYVPVSGNWYGWTLTSWIFSLVGCSSTIRLLR